MLMQVNVLMLKQVNVLMQRQENVQWAKMVNLAVQRKKQLNLLLRQNKVVGYQE